MATTIRPKKVILGLSLLVSDYPEADNGSGEFPDEIDCRPRKGMSDWAGLRKQSGPYFLNKIIDKNFTTEYFIKWK